MTDCAMLRLDPGRLTLWQYQAILHEHNRRHDPDGQGGEKASPDFDRLRRFMGSRRSLEGEQKGALHARAGT